METCSVREDELDAQRAPLLPGSARVRWTSVFAIVAMVALFAAISLGRYQRVLRVQSADIHQDRSAVALRFPVSRAVAARLHTERPVSLEVLAGTRQAPCRVAGRIEGVPLPPDAASIERLGMGALTSSDSVLFVRVVVNPSQSRNCRLAPTARVEALLDLGSDSYVAMFAAALLRR